MNRTPLFPLALGFHYHGFNYHGIFQEPNPRDIRGFTVLVKMGSPLSFCGRLQKEVAAVLLITHAFNGDVSQSFLKHRELRLVVCEFLNISISTTIPHKGDMLKYSNL